MRPNKHWDTDIHRLATALRTVVAAWFDVSVSKKAVLLCTVALFLPATAVYSQEFNNDSLRDDQRDLIRVHNAAVVVGIGSSGPLGTAIELTEFSTNLELKATPPILEIPGNTAVYPDALPGGGFACDYMLTLPQASSTY